VTTPQPTAEQRAIIDAATSAAESVMINAYAGTGKSTTLQMLGPHVPQKRVLALAFNKSIATGLKRRFPAHFKIMTLNGLGFLALTRLVPGAKFEGQKLLVIAHKLGLIGDEAAEVREICALAMNAGIVPAEFGVKGIIEDSYENWAALGDHEPASEAIGAAREMLSLGIREALQGSINFDDQVYMSVFFGARYPRYEMVLVDEAQDLSPLNHLQITKCKPERVIAVGDRFQAIYGFRGADYASMDNLREVSPAWIDRPLTTTFRCSKVIVRRNLAHAPGFSALKDAPEGRVVSFRNRAWNWQHTRDELAKCPSKSPQMAVLCRINAPLISLAFKLLAQHIPARVLGRDIGAKLIKLSRKIAKDDSMNREVLIARITAWHVTEVSKSEANKDGRAGLLDDQAESLLAIASNVRDAKELRGIINTLFADTTCGVTLASVHKSKGLEWDCVMHLDPFRCPSKFAHTDQAYEQELNLRYVLETRTKHTLIEANLGDFTT